MEYIVTGGQSRDIDSYSIRKVGIPSLVLMERASLAVAQAVEDYLYGDGPGRKARILSVCGSGNNGGDGMAAARILYERGYDAVILLVGNPDKLSEDASTQLAIARNAGMKVVMRDEVKTPEDCENFLAGFDVIIDAVFGTGLSREVGGSYRDWIHAINEAGSRGTFIAAVDIASGVDADDGKILGVAVKADCTVTFGYRKLGHVLYPGAMWSGHVICRDIGFDRHAIEHVSDAKLHFAYSDADLAGLPARRPDSNKGSYGKVLVIAGSRNMAGAAAFSARAAYAMGAGLVTIFTPECNRQILQALVPEAVMKTYPEDGADTDVLRGLLEKNSCAVVGPGLGTSRASAEIVKTVLDTAHIPLIIDADALNITAADKACRESLEKLSADVIITPHMMELSRLTGYNIQTLKTNCENICEEFSRINGVICIAKDARTRIYGAGQNVYVNLSGNNGMSTGGSGDVLTGILAGLTAQGLDAAHAAALGVYVHGRAGDFAAQKKSVYSMTASDIIEAIPELIRSVQQPQGKFGGN